MSIIGNPIMAGVSGPAASIFVTGLSETDTVTATKGSKTLTGKWTQKPNPALHGLPDSYTELEYIESTGTQYIDTGLVMETGFHIKGAVEFTSFINGVNGLFGTDGASDNARNNFGYLIGSNGSGWFVGRGGYFRGGSASLNTEYSFDVCNIYQKFFCKIDGVDVTQSAGVDDNQNRTSGEMPLFRCGVGSSYTYSNIKLKSFYVYETEDETALLRNFVPAKRNSDSVIGLYDIVNDVFYTNAGTGEFVAGPEVPQTIDGFLIKPIRDFGTWTVTATDGVQTATQDVLVDVITEYEIEMYYSKYFLRLYTIHNSNGDQYYEIREDGIYFYASSNSADGYNHAGAKVCDKNGNEAVIDAGDTICVSYTQGFVNNGSNASILRKASLTNSNWANLSLRQDISDFTYTFTESDYENSMTVYVDVGAISNGNSWMLLSKFQINGKQLDIWEG